MAIVVVAFLLSATPGLAAPSAASSVPATATATAATAHSGNKGGGKASKVALPVCPAGSSTGSTTYSCNTYGQNICNIAKGTCDLATNANLAKVAERTDCDFLAAPTTSPGGGCGLATREELSEFESEAVDVLSALAQENVSAKAAIAALSSVVATLASQLVPNPVITPPLSPDQFCTRVLTYDGTARYAPFRTTAYTVFEVVPTTGGTISCKPDAVAAFGDAVLVEAPKPDTCPLVPKASGGDYPAAFLIPGDLICQDTGDRGKSLYYTATIAWRTRFPCPAAPFARMTSDLNKPNSDLFSQGMSTAPGCQAARGCNPCRAATGSGQPSAEAICNSILSKYPAGSVMVASSWTWMVQSSWCVECVAASDPYCSPDGLNPFKVGV